VKSGFLEKRETGNSKLEPVTLARMDYLWTPWRYAYITSAGQATGCVFCEAQKLDDAAAGIVFRGTSCFVILNVFPYTSGHVMIVPYEHLDTISGLPPASAQEMMSLAQRMEAVLRKVYRPEGINMGVNIGKAAGAGVAGHVHMHVLPRWTADANFMSVIGETRILPEDLKTTFARLKAALG
jgi:ATP adenylyltransferase